MALAGGQRHACSTIGRGRLLLQPSTLLCYGPLISFSSQLFALDMVLTWRFVIIGILLALNVPIRYGIFASLNVRERRIMQESMDTYPALQAEDDGFLKHLKDFVIDLLQEPLGLDENDDFLSRVNRLLEVNADVVDKGASLPLYIPIKDDFGVIQMSKAVPVWSGNHIDFPLYPGTAKNRVENFIYGNPRRIGFLGKEFSEANPAFQVALVVHHIMDNVIIHALAAEAFVLGVYDEFPFEDAHYEKTGIPSTKLVWAHATSSLNRRWVLDSPAGYHGGYGKPEYNGWIIRIRGARPKEALLRDCWQDMRERFDGNEKPVYIVGGEEMTGLKYSSSNSVRRRVGRPEVDRMVQWVDTLAAANEFPMRGSRPDWVSAHARFEISVPALAGRWTADSMRRIYKRRTGHGISYSGGQ